MGQINIYRIDNAKKEDFLQKLTVLGDPLSFDREVSGTNYTLSFYYDAQKTSKDISWSWVFREFKADVPKVWSVPKGIVTVTAENDHTLYAITFGSAFFIADRYCDRDFGFEYACRIPYKNIKLTALINPVSVRNKTINSYHNYNHLDFGSGESLSKIKGKVIAEEETPIKDSVEIGTAIKFQLKEDSLDGITNAIEHIKNILTQKKITSIPLFKMVKDGHRIDELVEKLYQAIDTDSTSVLVSEFSIIGVTEIFNRCDSYILSYKGNETELTELTISDIREFFKAHHISNSQEMFHVKIASYENETLRNSSDILSILDFMEETERCLLVQGVWYEFNDDYINYLHASLAEIPVVYNSEYDLSADALLDFHKKKVKEESKDYPNCDDATILKKIQSKYYAERAFNLMRGNDGFTLGDRELITIDNAKIEFMDLYKENTLFVVKRGNSSADFTYVADQALMSASLYKTKKIFSEGKVSKIVIWLIFKRSTLLNVNNGTLSWETLNMLVLKNRLDQWKKEILLLGLQPEIWINYQK